MEHSVSENNQQRTSSVAFSGWSLGLTKTSSGSLSIHATQAVPYPIHQLSWSLSVENLTYLCHHHITLNWLNSFIFWNSVHKFLILFLILEACYKEQDYILFGSHWEFHVWECNLLELFWLNTFSGMNHGWVAGPEGHLTFGIWVIDLSQRLNRELKEAVNDYFQTVGLKRRYTSIRWGGDLM